MTDITLSMDGLLLNWLKQVGDSVKKGDIVAEFEADKATVEVEAPADGVLGALLAEVGSELKAGTVIAKLGGAAEAAPAPAAAPKAEAAPAPAPVAVAAAPVAASVTEDGRVKASPLARNIAKDKGIDLAQVAGTGPNGRITKADVEGFTPAAAAPAAKPAAAVAAAPAESAHGLDPASIPLVRLRNAPSGDEVELIDVSRMRKAVALGTTESNQQIPTFFVTTEIDLDPLLALRAQINAQIGDKGVKVSVNDMIVKAAALALREFPNLNSHYYGDKIARHKHINVGIAVAPATGGGVIYVVAKDADKVALGTLAATNKEMIERARELKLKPEDTRGATFSTSNLGPYEVDQFTAVINPPEAGVIAIGSGRKVPVVKADGTIGVGTRVKITLSVDHRVSDGAEGGQFMFRLKNLIENPMQLLL
jgi:pyruvate dehydrogenase E2 component (dihydrolipoamide acetyltransferase)